MKLTQRWPLLLAAWVLVMAVAAVGISAHERTLREGQWVLLELAPVDPRSLMQGDYMALSFNLNSEVEAQMTLQKMDSGEQSDFALLSVDEAGRASFVSLENTSDHGAGQVSIRIRQQGSRFSLGPNGFFFQEGNAAIYEEARWGGFRVAGDGTALLVSLHDDELNSLGYNRR
tara:strand:+ start:9345 stop:9863 length:519 start_codon:yes stop_codon:yes gene_type:complete